MKRTQRILRLGLVTVLLLIGGMWLWRHNRELSPAMVHMIPPPAVSHPLKMDSNTRSKPPTVVPERVRAVLTSTNLTARFEALRNLPQNLSTAEVASLCDLLTHDRMPNAPRGYTLAFKNDLLVALRRQIQPPMQLPEILIGIFRDQQADSALRDYALQHLTSWYEEILLPADVSPEAIQQKLSIITLLKEALDETSTSIAGTALLSLHRLGAADKAFDLHSSVVVDTAAKFANEPNANELVRITAFQVCAENQNKSVLPSIIDVARHDSRAELRISAIAAIGALGAKEDWATLKSLTEDPDSRVKKAAEAALFCLSSRVSLSPATRNI